MNCTHTTRRLLAAAMLAGGAASAAAVPTTIHLDTGAAWSIDYFDSEAGANRTGPAFTYDCLGGGGVSCVSITSTGFAGGTWLPGATAAGFSGQWQAYIDFVLPAGATDVRLSYDFQAVDDAAGLTLTTGGFSLIVAEAELGLALPAGTEVLSGPWSEPGAFRLALKVENNPGFLVGDVPRTITDVDGTAVAGRFRIDFDLPGSTVPEPGSLASAGLALAGVFAARRRARRDAWSTR